MMKMSVCFLLTLSAFGMKPDADDLLVKICALGDEKESPVAKLPARVALGCKTMQKAIKYKARQAVDNMDYDTYPFYVSPHFASPALWELLKPCLEQPSNVHNLAHNSRDLAEVLLAANYLDHDQLYNSCVSEWVDQNYAPHPLVSFPQEIEGALASALLAKHRIQNSLLRLAVEKAHSHTKYFICNNEPAVWTCALGKVRNSVAAGRVSGDIFCWMKKRHGWKRRILAKAHEGSEIGRLEFINNDSKLISSAQGKGLKIWDTDSGFCLHSFGDEVCDGFNFCYTEQRNLIAISAKDFTINLYDLNPLFMQSLEGEQGTPHLWLELTGHAGRIYSLDFSPQQDLLISSAEDGGVILWNLENGNQIYEFDLPENSFTVCFGNRGDQVAIGTKKGKVQICDIKKFFPEPELLDAHKNAIWGLAFNQDDSLLVTSSEDCCVKIWAVPEGECLRVIECMRQILFMDANFERNQILVAFADGNLGMINLGPLMSRLASQRKLLKYGLQIDGARFLVAAAQATRKTPLECVGEHARIFNSFRREAQEQLIKHFALIPPQGFDNRESNKKSSKKK